MIKVALGILSSDTKEKKLTKSIFFILNCRMREKKASSLCDVQIQERK